MAITKQEFLVLRELAREGVLVGLSDLDERTGLTSDEVDAALERLNMDGMVADGLITAAGVLALEPYRVKNAVIQAAGLCTRFAPIAYDMPKGLVEVRGEVLVERMIRQLNEAGVYDIVMVVGHKREMYAYLAAKYGVKLVENPDHATTNTCRSLYCALDSLSRTYVLFSDTYFVESPFERYVWEGFYATRPSEGYVDRWFFGTDEDGYVISMTKGGADGEFAGGFACLDEAIVAALAPLLRVAQDNADALSQVWEAVWEQHMDSVRMRTQCFSAGFLFDFDSMDDLLAFDPGYLKRVVSPTLDNICSVLACSREQIHDCYPLPADGANLYCHFAVGEREYVYRQPLASKGRLFDYVEETEREKEAARQGLNKNFVYEDPSFGWKITRFAS